MSTLKNFFLRLKDLEKLSEDIQENFTGTSVQNINVFPVTGDPDYSVSQATMRPQDLLSAFASELEKLCKEEENRKKDLEFCTECLDLVGEARKEVARIESEGSHTEDTFELMDKLNAILNVFAPAGHYFGPHEGDGADFGYWMITYDEEEPEPQTEVKVGAFAAWAILFQHMLDYKITYGTFYLNGSDDPDHVLERILNSLSENLKIPKKDLKDSFDLLYGDFSTSSRNVFKEMDSLFFAPDPEEQDPNGDDLDGLIRGVTISYLRKFPLPQE